MPEKETLEREEGQEPGSVAGHRSRESVHEEIKHIREGKHRARSTKQLIAIGLSKARRAGVKRGKPRWRGARFRADANEKDPIGEDAKANGA